MSGQSKLFLSLLIGRLSREFSPRSRKRKKSKETEAAALTELLRHRKMKKRWKINYLLFVKQEAEGIKQQLKRL